MAKSQTTADQEADALEKALSRAEDRIFELVGENRQLRALVTRLEEDVAFARRSTGRLLGGPNP